MVSVFHRPQQWTSETRLYLVLAVGLHILDEVQAWQLLISCVKRLKIILFLGAIKNKTK